MICEPINWPALRLGLGKSYYRVSAVSRLDSEACPGSVAYRGEITPIDSGEPFYFQVVTDVPLSDSGAHRADVAGAFAEVVARRLGVNSLEILRQIEDASYGLEN